MTTVAPVVSAGASFEAARDLTYIKARGRRLSEYEAVICHAHPDMETGYDRVDWSIARPDGRAPLERDNSRLSHPDWLAYRDPSQLWQRPYIRHQTAQEQAIQAAIDGARHNGALGQIEQSWLTPVLAEFYEGLAFLEWGLFRAYASVVREAPGDTLTMAYAFTAMDHLRHQQAIAMYSLDLDEGNDSYAEGQGRRAWLERPEFAPMRDVAERLIVCQDWAETVVVTNLLVEPLILAHAVNFFRRFAPLHGDVVTPIICMTAESDRRRNIAGASELISMATAERDLEGRPVPAAGNRDTLQDWIDAWAPTVLAAVEAFGAVFGLARVRPGVADTAADEVRASCHDLLAGHGLVLSGTGRS